MYIIKTAGNNMIPDCLQIRSEKFILLAYIRVDRPFQNIISKFKLEYTEQEFMSLINELPTGKIKRLKTKKRAHSIVIY